jgi:competence ComEA-like helix-hairpin-helix protein
MTQRRTTVALTVAVILLTSIRTYTTQSTEPDVLYVPTPQPVVEAMLELAGVKAGDVVYDLGSGDGRIVITAAKKYGARGVGIDIDPLLVKTATANAAAAGVSDRVRFVSGNIFSADVSEATVVTLYLLQSLNERLRPKLVRELRAGARVVSHVFNMGPEWPPEQTREIGASRIFLWTLLTGQNAKPDPAALKDDELLRAGEETTERVCGECHAVDEVTVTRRAPRDWSDMVNAMMDRGATATTDEVALIKRYLTRSFGLVRVNTATAEDLAAVLGLAARDAEAVVTHRAANGRFADAAALLKVPGIDRTKIDTQPEALRFD